jgi:hypothetical protein
MLPDVHFGTADGETIDWRKENDDDTPDDDAELDETPEDVIDLLGFDPANEV